MIKKINNKLSILVTDFVIKVTNKTYKMKNRKLYDLINYGLTKLVKFKLGMTQFLVKHKLVK